MTDYQKLADLITDIDFCMFTTVGKDGSVYSRPMSTLELSEDSFQGELYFFAKKDSPKVHEMEENQKVNLAYADPSDHKYVSVAGSATLDLDKDKMKELWRPAYKAWFPEGLNDPQICLIRVDVESAEYWDSPGSAIVHAIGFVKAAVTGRPFKGGENEKINFRNSPGIH